MNIVLDASAGIVLSSTATHRRLREHIAEASWIGAPALYDHEVTNAVWKYHRVGAWTEEQCATVLMRALELIDERASGQDLALEALALARTYDHPAYDMFYVALARRRDALLATTDEKLMQVARRAGAKVDATALDPMPSR